MTDAQGKTKSAGAGLSDEEMAEDVNSQTDSDLEHSDFFERESQGAASDTEAAKTTADEAAGKS